MTIYTVTVSAPDLGDAAGLMRQAIAEGREVRVHAAGDNGARRPLSQAELGELLERVAAGK